MTPNTVDMAAPFRWLARAFDVGRRNPKALFGALALVLAVVFALAIVQTVMQAGAAGNVTGLAVVMALGTVISWLVVPPLFGGMFRVLDAVERGRPVVSTDVFNAYGQGQGGKRLVLTNLVYSLAYMAVLALFLLTSLGQFFREYFTIIMATPVGAEPDQAALIALMQATPPTAFLWMPVLAVVVVVWLHASMLAQATAALREASVAECVVAGLLAMLRNVLPLLVFSLAMTIAGFVLVLLLFLLVGLVIGLLSLLSPLLGMVVILPVMGITMLATYALMFGFYYHAWRGIFDDEPEATPAVPGEIAV